MTNPPNTKPLSSLWQLSVLKVEGTDCTLSIDPALKCVAEVSDGFDALEGLTMTIPYPADANNDFIITAGKNIAKGPATYYFKIETEHLIPAGGKFRIIVPAGVGATQSVTTVGDVTTTKLLLNYKTKTEADCTYNDNQGSGDTPCSPVGGVDELFLQERPGELVFTAGALSFLENEVPVGARFEFEIENWYNPVLYEFFAFYIESYWVEGDVEWVIDRFGNMNVDQSNAAATTNIKLNTS